jgi:poly(hydroxyalkanoate) depolymerase family esterase
MCKLLLSMILLGVFSAGTIAQTGSIKVGSTTRTFIVYAPSGLPEHPSLVISMHGLGGSGSQQRSMSGFDKVADKGKFVVVYPDGTYTMSSSSTSKGWDISSNADVDFISALIDTMKVKYSIDPNRVYASGFSMGGMMSYKLACSLSDKIAAIGPASGYPLGNMITSCKPTRPVPICHTHGTLDSVVAYTTLENWVSKFVKSNGCSGDPVITNPTAKYKREYWGPCDNGSEIILYHFDGMKHAYVPTSTYNFSASDTFWVFFQKHPLNEGAAGVTTAVSTIKNTAPISVSCSNGIIYLQSEAGVQNVNVSDVSGRILFSCQYSGILTRHVNVPLGRNRSGVYFVKVTGTSGSSVSRVMIQ